MSRSFARVGGKFFFAILRLRWHTRMQSVEIIAEMERQTRKRISIAFIPPQQHAALRPCWYDGVSSIRRRHAGRYYLNTVRTHETRHFEREYEQKTFHVKRFDRYYYMHLCPFPYFCFRVETVFTSCLKFLQRCPPCVRHLNPNVYFVLETVFLVGTSFGLSMVIRI